MGIPVRAHNFGTYFVTTNTLNRRLVFKHHPNAELLMEKLEHYRPSFLLHAFVVMPDHIHLLLSPQGVALERVMAFVKGGFSHQLASKLSVWQRGYTDHRVRDGDEFQMRRQYIHDNPVRAKLVELPELYPYSSAYRSEEEKAYLSG